MFAASLAVTQIGCQDAAEGHWQQGWQGVRNTKRARADHCTPRLGGQSTARGGFVRAAAKQQTAARMSGGYITPAEVAVHNTHTNC